MKKILYMVIGVIILCQSNFALALDNTKYWFPQGVVPCMLTESQREQYAVVNINEYRKSTNYVFGHDNDLIEIKAKKAKTLGRPLIVNDLKAAQKDYRILQDIKASLTDCYSMTSEGEDYGSLNQNQEAQLNRILNEYGDSVLDDKLKLKLKIYRQRQAYMGTQNINKNSNQYQFTNMPTPKDRSDVERFYNGFEYTPVIPSANTIKNNAIQQGIGAFSNYLFRFWSIIKNLL